MCESAIDAVHPRFAKKPALYHKGFKIALVQLSVGADKAKNVAAAVSEIHKAKQQGAQIVALPECFNSPYGTKFFSEYAEEVPSGATCRALSRAAAEAGVCVVGGTVPERCGDELFNTCTVWDGSGKLLAQHRKMHLFDIDIPNKITFKESEVLSPGNQITTFEYQGVRIGVGICYDLRFGEMAHLMAKQGCSVLIYPAAFNMTTGPKHWELLARARANDEQLWVALVSPARDTEAGYVAWGHSTLVDPWANVVAKLDEKPGMLLADIDLSVVEEVRSQIPIRVQRRTDIYDTVIKTKC
ncbi:omega-amidase NIT2 isoform X1 [Maniola jurtina]|uniref:omega-amidase NIT2 isoform X1 n=1 Tax=Maniola jurtina TaxID=191418 RepID=UPI001E68A415|nr:omega-amidase NIT2 isoform X1 [Maniola jurtina]